MMIEITKKKKKRGKWEEIFRNGTECNAPFSKRAIKLTFK
jgi:hypothetical protein